MQKMVVSLAIMFAILVPVTSFAQGQKEINQQVAQAIADKLSDKYPEYTINVRYNGGVATLAGELYSAEQVNDATAYVQSLPGVSKVINNLKIVQVRTQIQAMPTSTRLGNNIIQQPVSEAPDVPSETLPTPIVTQPAPIAAQPTHRTIAQVSGQMQGVTDFSQQQAPVRTPVAPAIAAAPAVMAPAPTLAPATPAPNFATAAPVAPMTAAMAQASYVDAPQDLEPTNFAAPFNAPTVAPTTISTEAMPVAAGGSNFSGMPMPMSAQVPTAGRYDQPNVPNYAWPSYAAPNNYAEVAYPKLYCPQAAPYIGPFYPYPQVPMGWRKVTLEWHDGYWWLDFDDGTANGPFSPLFRQPNPKRY